MKKDKPSVIYVDCNELYARYPNSAIGLYTKDLIKKWNELSQISRIETWEDIKPGIIQRNFARNLFSMNKNLLIPHHPNNFVFSKNLSAIIYDFIACNPAIVGYIKSKINEFFYNSYARNAKRLFFFNKHVQRQFVAKFYFPLLESKCVVITPFLRLDFLNELSLNESTNNIRISLIKYKYVMALGTGEPRKNISRVLHIYKIMKEYNASLKLVLYGKSSNIEWNQNINNAIIKENISFDDVIQLGRISDADLVKWMSNAEVFLFPSLEEGVGLPPMEALAAGTKVVISSDPVLDELFGQYNNCFKIYLDDISKDNDIVRSLNNSNIDVDEKYKVRNDFSIEKTIEELCYSIDGTTL